MTQELERFASKLKYVPIIDISPEAYGLPIDMDPMAQYVTREGGGGLGDIIRGRAVGLFERGIPFFYVGPNYKAIFKTNSGLTGEEYMNTVHSTSNDKIKLLSSPHFSYLGSIYSGNTAYSAALLQDLSLQEIKNIRGEHHGKAIVHTDDQFSGIIPAYCNLRGIPSIHTLHNGFTFNIPYSYYRDADLTGMEWGLKNNLYDTTPGSNILDSHATAVKNTDIATFVGQRFYEEILEGRFDNWDIFKIAQNTFREVKIKAELGKTRVVMNGIADEELPENQDYLAKPYGPLSKNILGAKNIDKIDFQKRVGLTVNEDAILLYWPSRIDNTQKGIESLLECVLPVLLKNPSAQLAIVGNDVTKDENKYNNWIRNIISQVPQGRMTLNSFNKTLSNKGYSAADIIVGCSHYEPFGLFWLQGVCCGAFGIGPNNGGAADILREYSAEKGTGNGFIFKNTDAAGLEYGMEKAISNVKKLRKNPEMYNTHIKNMMIKAREDFSLDKMVEGYMEIYEELGVKYNLFNNGYIHFIQK